MDVRATSIWKLSPIILLCFAAVALVIAGCNSDDKSPSFLYVTQGTSGTLESVEESQGTFLLTIHGVAPEVIVFSDRPDCIGLQVPVSQFIDDWGRSGFVEDPPNAAVVLASSEANTNADVLIVELESPEWTEETKTLVFQVRTIGDETTSSGLSVHALNADDRLPPSFGHISLFIDSAEIWVPAGCPPFVPAC